MHALISADMEGATGVTCPDDVRPGTPQWERFRRLFTGDVKAVCEGFFDAGVTDVTVNEAHSTMRNLLLEDLDPRVRLLSGNHKPFGMMEGIQARPELIAFLGYHAGPGEPGVLSHTFTGFEIFEVKLNGRPMSEGYLNALLAAEYGARLALVSGDDLTCADAKDYAPGAQTVAVKEAVDRYTALCLTPARTSVLLREAAQAGVAQAQVPPLPAGPFRCEVTFTGTSSATMAACIPTVERTGPRTVVFSAATVAGLYPCFRVVARIGAGAAEPVYG
ncbi:MAG: M55 family metallopeptidase [Streptosporangiaceae bacterium]|nr:M55 family metallopeptidase [Streptosporangiaceae bacterium]